MKNSADPDQLASSGSTLLTKEEISGFSRTRVKLNRLVCTKLCARSQLIWIYNVFGFSRTGIIFCGQNRFYCDLTYPILHCTISVLGFIKMTSLLIENGATTAILNTKGNLFTSPEYEGVRLQIETHRSAHSKQVMKLVSERSKKALSMLAKVWLVGIFVNNRSSSFLNQNINETVLLSTQNTCLN